MFPASTRLRIPNCTSISSAVFAQLTAANSYTLQWVAPSPTPQNCPSYGRSGPHLIHGSLGLLESTAETASRSVQPFCWAHDCDIPTDRQTDRQTTLLGSVTIGRICVVLRCGLKRKSVCALICHHIDWTTWSVYSRILSLSFSLSLHRSYLLYVASHTPYVVQSQTLSPD